MMTRLRPSRGFISAKSSWSNLDSNGIRQVVYQWVIFETTGFLERCQLTEMSLPEFLVIQDRTNRVANAKSALISPCILGNVAVFGDSIDENDTLSAEGHDYRRPGR